MKQFFIFLTVLGLGFTTWAAPTTETTTEESEIQLEDIQAELMAELDTVEVTDEDVAFLDEEIEKAANTKTAPKTATAKPATTTPAVKK